MTEAKHLNKEGKEEIRGVVREKCPLKGSKRVFGKCLFAYSVAVDPVGERGFAVRLTKVFLAIYEEDGLLACLSIVIARGGCCGGGLWVLGGGMLVGDKVGVVVWGGGGGGGGGWGGGEGGREVGGGGGGGGVGGDY